LDYPQYSSILEGLRYARYGKAYTQCIKHRIIAAIENDCGAGQRDAIIEWAGERPSTWKNTNLRCSKASVALVKLGEQASKGPLTADQDHAYRILKVLLSGPIQLFPFSPIAVTGMEMDSSWSEWQKVKVEREALNLSATKMEELSKKVEAWFPSFI
jgi:hypothetical protein